MDQEKLQALANHLEIDYFNHNDTYYVGASQEEYENFEVKELNSKEDSKIAFDEWIDDNYSLLEEEITNEYKDYFKYGKEEYLVYTDEEADSAAYDSVYSIWEDCYLTEDIQNSLGFLVNYIDLKKATLDSIKIDGRGHTLASYDGEECEEYINSTIYYIYRVN